MDIFAADIFYAVRNTNLSKHLSRERERGECSREEESERGTRQKDREWATEGLTALAVVT